MGAESDNTERQMLRIFAQDEIPVQDSAVEILKEFGASSPTKMT